MICISCKAAGRYNSQARQLGSETEDIGAMTLYEFARRNHIECSDICCCCQHLVGDGNLNYERID